MKYILSLLCFVSLLSCKKPKLHTNEIVKIELARSGAWSDFGAAIGIDSSLSYRYYNGNTRKYFTGKITEEFWDTLNTKFKEMKYKVADTTDNIDVVDVNHFELIIHWKDHKRRIVRVHGSHPDSVLSVMLWLNGSAKNVKLHRIRTQIPFETTYQNPPPSPHFPPGFKFLPPVEKK